MHLSCPATKKSVCPCLNLLRGDRIQLPSPLIVSPDYFSLWTWTRIQTARSTSYFNGCYEIFWYTLYYYICMCTKFLWPLRFGWLLVLSPTDRPKSVRTLIRVFVIGLSQISFFFSLCHVGTAGSQISEQVNVNGSNCGKRGSYLRVFGFYSRTRQIIRYRATATLRRPQIKQYTTSK